MNNGPLKNYAAALADLMSEYARELTAEDGSQATLDLLQRIGSGEEKVVLVSQLVPFSVAAMRLDEHGNAGDELFSIKAGDLH